MDVIALFSIQATRDLRKPLVQNRSYVLPGFGGAGLITLTYFFNCDVYVWPAWDVIVHTGFHAVMQKLRAKLARPTTVAVEVTSVQAMTLFNRPFSKVGLPTTCRAKLDKHFIEKLRIYSNTFVPVSSL